MAKFAYKNAKNGTIGPLLFELNYRYHFYIFYKKDTNLCSKSKSTNKLLAKLKKLITICRKNLYQTQKLQKQA